MDPQGNSKPEILIEPLEGYEVLYPSFMRIHNQNRTLEFMADDAEYSGKQYFF